MRWRNLDEFHNVTFLAIKLKWAFKKKVLININLITLSPTAQYLDQNLCVEQKICFTQINMVNMVATTGERFDREIVRETKKVENHWKQAGGSGRYDTEECCIKKGSYYTHSDSIIN